MSSTLSTAIRRIVDPLHDETTTVGEAMKCERDFLAGVARATVRRLAPMIYRMAVAQGSVVTLGTSDGGRLHIASFHDDGRSYRGMTRIYPDAKIGEYDLVVLEMNRNPLTKPTIVLIHAADPGRRSTFMSPDDLASWQVDLPALMSMTRLLAPIARRDTVDVEVLPNDVYDMLVHEDGGLPSVDTRDALTLIRNRGASIALSSVLDIIPDLHDRVGRRRIDVRSDLAVFGHKPMWTPAVVLEDTTEAGRRVEIEFIGHHPRRLSQIVVVAGDFRAVYEMDTNAFTKIDPNEPIATYAAMADDLQDLDLALRREPVVEPVAPVPGP